MWFGKTASGAFGIMHTACMDARIVIYCLMDALLTIKIIMASRDLIRKSAVRAVLLQLRDCTTIDT